MGRSLLPSSRSGWGEAGFALEHETLSGRLGGRGFFVGVVGLAAESPLSRPGKEQAKEVPKSHSPIVHNPFF
jgi:hypothetical protein